MKLSIDMENRLFKFDFADGYSCLGFDNCFEKATKLAKELKKSLPQPFDKSLPGKNKYYQSLYDYYSELVEIVRQRNLKTGWKSKSDLTPQLIGLEGKVVRVIDSSGDERVFIVGRSSGFIPCHIELESDEEMSGGAVHGAPFESVRVIRN